MVVGVSALLLVASIPAGAAGDGKGTIFVLMVWDGLRPDFVTRRDTPNLDAMASEGVRLSRHHALYPTVTMVNATALATGADVATGGIFGDRMFVGPLLDRKPHAPADPLLREAMGGPVNLESSPMLAELNGAGALAGRLLGLDSVVQEVEREGGYAAVIGKRGPTFLFDDRVAALKGGGAPADRSHLFVADDVALPRAVAPEILGALSRLPQDPVPAAPLDDYFTRLVIDKALPEASSASQAGLPALVVLWMHDPDWTQHVSGLGTLPALEALQACDRNLGRIRTAIAQLGIEDRTDLMVASDHGFATIRMTVSLADSLVAVGLKRSADSDDVMVAPNGGSDLLYLSAQDFPAPQARREHLQRIVNFVAAQEWSGPIFSRESSGDQRKPYLGWIDGTFSQAVAGIFNPKRSPDLVISFGELPELDNSGLTGPDRTAFLIGARGQQAVRNKSKPLASKVKGVLYADTGRSGFFTTGMGMHGSAGARELLSFCAAVGPSFRRRFVDRSPTGNADAAPTIASILGLELNVGPGAVFPNGRTMSEALQGGERVGGTRTLRLTARLELQGMAVVTKLQFLRVDGHSYLDDSSVERVSLGSSP